MIMASPTGFLIGGLASLGAGLLNKSSADNTNDIAQYQFKKNLEFQKYQYEDMKRYNAYPNQVRLMRDAGLNPALMYGSSPSGSPVASVGGVAPTASQHTPDFSFLPSAASGLMSAFTQNDLAEKQGDKLEAETANEWTENSTKLRRDMQTLLNLKAQYKKTNKDTELIDNNIAYIKKQLYYADEKLEWENQNERFKAAGLALDNTLKELEVAMKPYMQKAELGQLAALAFMNWKTGQAAGETIEEIKARTKKELNEYWKSLPEALQGQSRANIFLKGGTLGKGAKLTDYVLNKIFGVLSLSPKL